MSVENDDTITIRIWEDTLPKLLHKSALYLIENRDKIVAIWAINIHPVLDGGINSRWVAMITYYNTKGFFEKGK